MILPALLAQVAAKLNSLGLNYAFVGGSIVEFLLDHSGLSSVRPTDDLDVIVEIVAGRNYSEVEHKLRAAGFEHDMSVGAHLPMAARRNHHRHHAHRRRRFAWTQHHMVHGGAHNS